LERWKRLRTSSEAKPALPFSWGDMSIAGRSSTGAEKSTRRRGDRSLQRKWAIQAQSVAAITYHLLIFHYFSLGPPGWQDRSRPRRNRAILSDQRMGFGGFDPVGCWPSPKTAGGNRSTKSSSFPVLLTGLSLGPNLLSTRTKMAVVALLYFGRVSLRPGQQRPVRFAKLKISWRRSAN
jgi:hypothetical protein